MKKRIFLPFVFKTFSLLFLGLNMAFAQLPQADTLKTNKGNIIVQPIFHGSLVLEINQQTIYVDPYNGATAYKNQPVPDFILITDIHPDHLDTNTLNALNTSKATFIVPQAVADKMPSKFKEKMVVINNGEKTEQKEISISAIPMYNLPDDENAKHTKGRGNGYIIKFGGKTVYISGDTEDIKEMRQLKDIDVAFVCMNVPYTMTIDQAASAVLEFKPRVVYPYHYRGSEGLSDVESFKKMVQTKNPKIEVRLRNWYVNF